jgi:spore coat protein U-like protein
MANQIIGEDGTSLAAIDAVSNAMRVTLYDSAGVEISSNNFNFGAAANLGQAVNSTVEFDNSVVCLVVSQEQNRLHQQLQW